MTDDLKNKGPQDRSRINIHELWEVEYWCRELGCTQAKLREAVNAVGVSVAHVRQYLSTH